jgi:hypothetical protein
MDFLKPVSLLVGVVCITALGLFGSGHLASSALTLLGLLVLRSRL